MKTTYWKFFLTSSFLQYMYQSEYLPPTFHPFSNLQPNYGMPDISKQNSDQILQEEFNELWIQAPHKLFADKAVVE